MMANMWKVRRFTVDDAYISFRYARNLIDGHGLVFNPGEAVEGYSNFLWTVLIAGGMQVGIEPVIFTKILGLGCATATMVCTYLLAHRLRPFGVMPCIATWLLASSMATSGYAIFGLETSGFVALVTGGVLLFFREQEREDAFPWSGVVFAAAALTRPEGPLFIGLAALWLGRRAFGRQNLIRVALFVVPVLIHLLWRHHFYGEWLPNTALAKTGDSARQFRKALSYLQDYFVHVGPIAAAPLVGLYFAIRKRKREILLPFAIGAAWYGYVLTVGRDWMPFFRFMAPMEPFWFLVAGYAVREVAERGRRWLLFLVVPFLIFVGIQRAVHLRKAQHKINNFHEPYWREVYGSLAEYFMTHERGLIGLGDLGYVSYETNLPILDLIGLTDREIARFEGGYTRKYGMDYRDYLFERDPAYFVFSPGRKRGCRGQHFKLHRKVANDPRFSNYRLAAEPGSERFGGLCVFARRDVSLESLP